MNKATQPVHQGGSLGILPVSSARNEGEPMVTVISPRAFILTLTHSHHVQVKAGVQEMPQHLLENFYVKAHGVKVYTPENVNVPNPEDLPNFGDKHLEFIQFRGYEIKTLEALKEFYANLPKPHQLGLLKDFETWCKKQDVDVSPDPASDAKQPEPEPEDKQPEPEPVAKPKSKSKSK